MWKICLRVFSFLIALGLGMAQVGETQEQKFECFIVLAVSQTKAPLSALHIEEAQAAGYPHILTIDRQGTKKRRAASLRGIPTKKGFDRDEYPSAVFLEGGAGASVRYIPANDNRSAGAQIGNQLKGKPNGCNALLTTNP